MDDSRTPSPMLPEADEHESAWPVNTIYSVVKFFIPFMYYVYSIVKRWWWINASCELQGEVDYLEAGTSQMRMIGLKLGSRTGVTPEARCHNPARPTSLFASCFVLAGSASRLFGLGCPWQPCIGGHRETSPRLKKKSFGKF